MNETHAVQVVINEELEKERNMGLVGLEGTIHDGPRLQRVKYCTQQVQPQS